jgi:hypothetical protein
LEEVKEAGESAYDGFHSFISHVGWANINFKNSAMPILTHISEFTYIWWDGS